MTAIVQYIVYFLVGMFYMFVMGAYFTVAAGFSYFAVILVFFPLFLAGYVSGLSFFFPRISAILSMFLILPFLIVAIYDSINKTPASEPMIFVIPSIIIIVISFFVIFQRKPSLWSLRQKKIFKVLILIFATIPALLATSILISLLIKIGNGFFQQVS